MATITTLELYHARIQLRIQLLNCLFLPRSRNEKVKLNDSKRNVCVLSHGEHVSVLRRWYDDKIYTQLRLVDESAARMEIY